MGEDLVCFNAREGETRISGGAALASDGGRQKQWGSSGVSAWVNPPRESLAADALKSRDRGCGRRAEETVEDEDEELIRRLWRGRARRGAAEMEGQRQDQMGVDLRRVRGLARALNQVRGGT